MSTAPPRRVVPCDELRCCMLRAYTPTACGCSTVRCGALARMRHGCTAARHAGLSPGCTRSRGSRTTAPRRSSPTGRATMARRGCSRPARPAQRRTPQRVRPPMHRTSARARVCASVCTHMHVRTHTRKRTRKACVRMHGDARTNAHARAGTRGMGRTHDGVLVPRRDGLRHVRDHRQPVARVDHLRIRRSPAYAGAPQHRAPTACPPRRHRGLQRGLQRAAAPQRIPRTRRVLAACSPRARRGLQRAAAADAANAAAARVRARQRRHSRSAPSWRARSRRARACAQRPGARRGVLGVLRRRRARPGWLQ